MVGERLAVWLALVCVATKRTSTGDVVPVGRRGFPTQKRAPVVAAGQFVICYWPAFITFYKDGKFHELHNMAKDAVCTVKLKGRSDWRTKKIVA